VADAVRVNRADILRTLYRDAMLESIDHVVLTASDIDATIRFYVEGLGAELIRFGDGRRAIRVGTQKLNLHAVDALLEPHADHPRPGSLDICFVTRLDPDEVVARLQAAEVDIEVGPVPRTGAAGPIISVYCRDPDGNLIEIARYPSEIRNS
jgi:catechol 2,3-dioxygenase-like lactoylglutathione lyase family enzyme